MWILLGSDSDILELFFPRHLYWRHFLVTHLQYGVEGRDRLLERKTLLLVSGKRQYAKPIMKMEYWWEKKVVKQLNYCYKSNMSIEVLGRIKFWMTYRIKSIFKALRALMKVHSQYGQRQEAVYGLEALFIMPFSFWWFSNSFWIDSSVSCFIWSW